MTHTQPGQTSTPRSRASPAEPGGVRGLAFEIQVNSCCHGQALWVHRACPPLTQFFQYNQESLGWELPLPTSASSRVPDRAVIYDGLVPLWPAAHLPGGRGRVGTGRDHKLEQQKPWSGSPSLCRHSPLAEQRVSCRCSSPPLQPPFPQACGSLLLSKMPVCVPSPRPPRCAHILRNMRTRGGWAAGLAELPAPH